ncbi:hypothetical protein EV363DRAFT_1480092 [Boletus edulis]|nr:hypothetical protein EV363DRAFT_1480092 [Boletus edulis]
MSDQPTMSNEPRDYAFTVALTVYSALKQSSSSKGKTTAAKRQEKSIKTKELVFPLGEENYVDFLESILEKHGQTQYKVSHKQSFPFKFTMPKIKNQRAEAMDVDNVSDYKEMVRKIHDGVGDSGVATKIAVDMKHVEKLLLHQVHGRAGDDELSGSDNDQTGPALRPASNLDTHLARWRIKLAKKYKNDYDEGLTYITPSGVSIPLTPAMVLDWARALEEGQATVNMPPNIPSFDAANKAPFLHPARKAQAQTASQLPSPNPATDINSLTSVLLLQTIANLSQSTGTRTPPVANPTPPILIPTTPVRHASAKATTSPPVPSPSQLARFLEYAETELHVLNATAFERRLAAQHIGPDILPEIDDKTLASEIGIPAGDIVRLKKGSTVWWNGPDAKRKRSDTGQSSASHPKSPTRPRQKRVAYEKRYHDKGASRFTGPPMIAGDDDEDKDKDYDIWYESTEHQKWLPVPRGFIVCEDAEEDNETFWS